MADIDKEAYQSIPMIDVWVEQVKMKNVLFFDKVVVKVRKLEIWVDDSFVRYVSEFVDEVIDNFNSDLIGINEILVLETN